MKPKKITCFKGSYFKVKVDIVIENIRKVHRYCISDEKVDFSFDFYVHSSNEFGDIFYQAIELAREQFQNVSVDWRISSVEVTGVDKNE